MYLRKFFFVIVPVIFGSVMALSQTPPTLLLPTNNNNCQGLTVDLEWQEIPAALSYIVQIAENADFSEYILHQPNLEMNKLTVILNDWGKRYWWRVSAVYSGGGIGTSTPFSFWTKAAPVLLVGPANGMACLDLNVRFTWNKHDAEFYTIRIATDSLFKNIAYEKNNLTDTTIVIKLPTYQTKYYWQVNSLKGTCATSWSLVRTLSTKTAIPTQLAPTNGAKGTALFTSLPFKTTLKWKPVPNAATYHLQVSTTADFKEPEVDLNSLTDTSYVFEIGEAYNTVYYWRLAVTIDGCKSDWTGNFTFKTPYAAPNLSAPTNTELCVSMIDNLFRWTTIETATNYRVQISDTDTFANILFDVGDIGLNETSIILKRPLSEHFWRVKAQDNQNDGLWSAIRKFTSTQKQPNFTTPVDGAVGLLMNLVITWENLGEGNRYDFRLYANEKLSIRLLDSTNISTNTIAVTVKDNNATYYWQVRARKDDCIGDWSRIYTFKTLIQPPVLTQPADFSSKVSVYPIFSWEKVEDALFYQIQVSRDSNFTSIFKTADLINALSFTFAGEVFDEETRFYWRVRAKNNDGTSLWSKTFRFSTGTQPLGPPILLVPANLSIKVPFDVELLWNRVQGADAYRVQIAFESNFLAIVKDTILASTRLSIPNIFERYTNYHWRALSINKGGEGLWSEAKRFRTKDIAPEDQTVLTSPANNTENLPNSFTLNWNEVDRALGYELQIASTNNFAEGTFVINTSAVWQNSRLVYELPYNSKLWWRVRAWNEDGQAPWSNTWNFTTLNPASVQDDYNTPSSYSYPNPAENVIEIVFNSNSGNTAEMKILNILGKEVKSLNNIETIQGKNSIQLNTSNFAPGIYFYEIKADNTIIRGKFSLRK